MITSPLQGPHFSQQLPPLTANHKPKRNQQENCALAIQKSAKEIKKGKRKKKDRGGTSLTLPSCLKQQQQHKDGTCETTVFKTLDVRQWRAMTPERWKSTRASPAAILAPCLGRAPGHGARRGKPAGAQRLPESGRWRQESGGDQGSYSLQDRVPGRRGVHRARTLEIWVGSPSSPA